MNYENIFNTLVKVLNDPAEAPQYFNNPDAYLDAAGITPDEKNLFLQLTFSLNAVRQSQVDLIQQRKEIEDVNRAYRKGITQTIEQTIRGFRSTMLMYKVSFYLGIAMIITAVVFAFLQKSSLYSILFGSIGTLDLLTFFIAKPPQSLQQSRSEQAKLNAAFYSWFIDLYNWNSFFYQFSSKGQQVDFDTVKQVSQSQIENTERLMTLISEHITPAAKQTT